ncbi:MAG: hypothetical protein WBA57_08730 [Elainellaceae cyanobacterium]
MTTTIDGSQAHPGEAWQPSEDTFDQFMIYGAADLHVGISVHTDIPLSFCKPMLDMAGQYAPIILGVQLPGGSRPKDHDLRRSIFHQCIPRYDLSKLLKDIQETEPDWIRDGNTLLSGPRTEISAETVFDIAEKHFRLPTISESDDELTAAPSFKAKPKKRRSPSWKSALVGGIGLLIGLSIGLAF